MGSLNQEITGVVVSMDVTSDVLDWAIREGCNMIVTHHPLIFRPLKTIITDTYPGKLLGKILKRDLVIYNAHTNLDQAHGGINDRLAELFDLKNPEYISETVEERLLKMVVYVPQTHVDEIYRALTMAEAGNIGDYSDCSFSAEGTGRFRPLEGSSPFIGQKGKLEEVAETRIETIIRKADLGKTLEKIMEYHPYEEPAYDIYPLENRADKYGYGRIGDIEPLTMEELASLTKRLLGISHVRVYGNSTSKISRLALCGGAGSDFIGEAAHKGAQVYITGDIKYHDAQMAHEKGLILIDGSHYGTERIILPVIKNKLDEVAGERIRILVHEDMSFHYRTY